MRWDAAPALVAGGEHTKHGVSMDEKCVRKVVKCVLHNHCDGQWLALGPENGVPIGREVMLIGGKTAFGVDSVVTFKQRTHSSAGSSRRAAAIAVSA